MSLSQLYLIRRFLGVGAKDNGESTWKEGGKNVESLLMTLENDKDELVKEIGR